MSLMGILGNIALAAFKLTAGIIGKSGAMVSDAAHSLSDVVATLIAYIGVRLSRQEEDANHPYGHERLECVASLILSLILAGTGIGVGTGVGNGVGTGVGANVGAGMGVGAAVGVGAAGTDGVSVTTSGVF